MRKFIVFILVFVFAFSLQLFGQTWSARKRLTFNSGSSTRPAIATDPSNGIHVVWEDNTPGNHEIIYKRSTDGGTTWSGRTRLTWNRGDSKNPSIAVDTENGIHVVWYNKIWGNCEIFYRRSTDGGTTWSSLTRLTWNSGSSINPAIAIDSSNGIHVVWSDDTPGNNELFHKRSTDRGNTWSGITRLTWNQGRSLDPSIAADTSNGLHVVWSDGTPLHGDQIFYKKSTDGGSTWSVNKQLTWYSRQKLTPSIALDSSNGIHVVYDMFLWSVFYKNSFDMGETWSGPTRLIWKLEDLVVVCNPSITTDSGKGIHVVWVEMLWSSREIIYNRSNDSGVTWPERKLLTWNYGSSRFPSIASDKTDAIHMTWMDSSPYNWEIFYINRN